MGIKNLNRFLRDKCPQSIKMITMENMRGKTIAIDISIYLYKFEAENALIENMYLMMSLFKSYDITPIFVFDGKPPTEKKALLIKRLQEKRKAECEYEILKKKVDDAIDEADDVGCSQIYQKKMEALKKQFIYISKDKIDQVKKLIEAYGSVYYDAPFEADEMCALLVIQNKAWACLSEDMDLFVYGCNRILRYISLIKHNMVLYDTSSILEELGISQKELREICVVSGTDYNTSFINHAFPLRKTLQIFKTFRKEQKRNETPRGSGLYEWLYSKKQITEQEYEKLEKIDKMFHLEDHDRTNNLQEIDKKMETAGSICQIDLMEILKKDGFLFV